MIQNVHISNGLTLRSSCRKLRVSWLAVCTINRTVNQLFTKGLRNPDNHRYHIPCEAL